MGQIVTIDGLDHHYIASNNANKITTNVEECLYYWIEQNGKVCYYYRTKVANNNPPYSNLVLLSDSNGNSAWSRIKQSIAKTSAEGKTDYFCGIKIPDVAKGNPNDGFWWSALVVGTGLLVPDTTTKDGTAIYKVGSYYYIAKNNQNAYSCSSRYDSSEDAKQALIKDNEGRSQVGSVTNSESEKDHEIVPDDDTSSDPNVDQTLSEEEEKQVQANINASTLKLSEIGNKFNETMTKVNSMLTNNYPLYTFYLKFWVGDVLLTDTTSADWVLNNLVSFSFNQNCSGQANTFTLNISYCIQGQTLYDIGAIDKALMGITTISKDASTAHTFDEIKDLQSLIMNCKFQYGYGNFDCKSDMYTGQVTKFKCSLQDGNLNYTITGYGGLYTEKEVKISCKPEYLTTPNKIDPSNPNPIAFIQNIYENEYGEKSDKKGIYGFKIADNVYSDGELPKYGGDDITNFNDVNIFDVISDILNATLTPAEAKLKAEAKDIDPSQKVIYTYALSSNTTLGGRAGTIIILKQPGVSQYTDSEDNTETMKKSAKISFNWFAPGGGDTGVNHLVKSWNPDFDGSILVANVISTLKYGNVFNTMDDDGNIVQINSKGGVRVGVRAGDTSHMNTNTIQEYSQWSKFCQYPYQASIVLQGCPCEIPMTEILAVNASIFNQKHHSSGYYYVIGKKDDISSSGYQTTLDLFKLEKQFDPEPKSYNVKYSYVNGKYVKGEYDEDGNLIGIEEEIPQEELIIAANNGDQSAIVARGEKFEDDKTNPYSAVGSSINWKEIPGTRKTYFNSSTKTYYYTVSEEWRQSSDDGSASTRTMTYNTTMAEARNHCPIYEVDAKGDVIRVIEDSNW